MSFKWSFSSELRKESSETSKETKAWCFNVDGVQLWCSLAGVNKRKHYSHLFQLLGIFSLTDVKRTRGRERGGGGGGGGVEGENEGKWG